MNLLLPLFLLLAPAGATQIRYTDQPCPIDPDDVVRVYEKVSANTHGGYDSDGADYSTKGQWRAFAVSTCGESLFSLYGGDIGMELSAGQIAALQGALTRALGEEVADAKDPQVWERYAIAAHMYETLGRGPLFLADLWLEASWTARDEAVGVYVGLRGPQAARETLALGREELKKDLPPDQRRTLLYNLARVAHRGGFAAERDEWLAAFQADGPLSPKEAEAVARFRKIVDKVEPRYQDKAIAAFREGLRDRDLPVESRLRSTYLLADLLRRRGQADEARPLFEQVARDERAPRELREMALFLGGEPGSGR